MKVAPSHRLYGLGVILLAALTTCSRNFSRTGEPSFLIPLGVAGVAYLLAIRDLTVRETLGNYMHCDV